ncbi:RrF2 family transcriptional regulator [Treponema sp.]|uniref:RrF2 family transcriptional regulator n=1 Tax=Treponema sp. TaxID=166 RepID=UPI003F10B323
MLISTRGRYALRVIIELSSRRGEEYVPLNVIAENQDVSLKYLESIVALLVKAGYVEGLRGKKGGYRLTKDSSEYSVGEILKLTEGSLAPVSCLEENAARCPRTATCKTLPMWEKLNALICNYLYSVKISDLMEPASVSDWVI